MPACSAPFERRGFAAIELVIVIALAAVLVAIASSAYKTYTVRAQVRAGLARAESLQEAVAEAYLRRGEVLEDRTATGHAAPPLGSVLSALEVVNGRIDLRYGYMASVAIQGRLLSLTPYETVEREIVWVCGNRIPGLGLNPLGFPAGGRQALQIPSTIEPRYLPAECQ